MKPDITVILLAGGQGSRFAQKTPKQYLPLGGKILALHSFDFFLKQACVQEIVVVCAAEYQKIFQKSDLPALTFAPPGKRRQDSLINGFQKRRLPAALCCIHDAARPFIRQEDFTKTLAAARATGAATLGYPVSETIKSCTAKMLVKKTLPRKTLYQIQTPQIILSSLLQRAIENVLAKQLLVTDDVSMVEALQEPVQVVSGSNHNLKITVEQDLKWAEFLCQTNTY